jgi:hypothetical protein
MCYLEVLGYISSGGIIVAKTFLGSAELKKLTKKFLWFGN